jgi:nicotinate phosphoribosyltransferase
MAHSYVEAHGDELEAFLDFAYANPESTTLLIDTYDVHEGAKKAIAAAKKLKERGIRVRAVRIDSGDLLTLSQDVRRILDQGGFQDIRIFASGNLDEYAIRELMSQGAPIDGFGVGTKLDTSEDAPYLECAYKLMEYAGRPRFKKSQGKATVPGRKQVFRQFDGTMMRGDIITIEGDEVEGIPLLSKVMSGGQRISGRGNLKEIASYARSQLQSLPPHFRELKTKPPYPVIISPALVRLKKEIML